LSILLLYQVLTRPPVPTLFPYTTLFRSPRDEEAPPARALLRVRGGRHAQPAGCAAARGDRIGRGAVHDRRRDRRRLAGIIHERLDRKSTRLNSSHVKISYAVFCLKKKII